MVCFVSALSLWLRYRVPVPIGRSAVDDMLFVRAATSLVNGDWLGPFDDLTLAKGPSYPMFMAAMHALGIRLKVGEQATYLLACLFVAGSFYLVARRLVLSTIVFSVLALNPVNFSFQSAELLRDNWHASLNLLFPATVFVALFMAISGFRIVWLVLAALFAGVVGAIFWMCREEGISIVPTIAIIAIGLPLLRWRRWRSLPPDARFGPVVRRRSIGYAAATVAIAIGLVVPTAAVGLINERHYGVDLINDWSAGAYAQAYADWTRVGGGSQEFWVPLTAEQRALVYPVSAAARELEPYLEAADSPYASMACKAPNCDFPGAFIGWELRLAALQAGHFTSETQVQEFFGRLDDDIVAGCDSGALACTGRLPAALQPLQRTTVPKLAASFGTILKNSGLSVGLFDEPTEYWPDPLNRLPFTLPVVDGIPTDHDIAASQAAHFTATKWPYDVLAADLHAGDPIALDTRPGRDARGLDLLPLATDGGVVDDRRPVGWLSEQIGVTGHRQRHRLRCDDRPVSVGEPDDADGVCRAGVRCPARRGPAVPQ